MVPDLSCIDVFNSFFCNMIKMHIIHVIYVISYILYRINNNIEAAGVKYDVINDIVHLTSLIITQILTIRSYYLYCRVEDDPCSSVKLICVRVFEGLSWLCFPPDFVFCLSRSFKLL